MSRVAVVVLNFNGVELLQRYLPSVVTHSGTARIVLADNGSTDTSVAWTQEHLPQVEVILLEHNWGFCGGYNRALKVVQAEYVVLLNSDVEVTPHWLEPLVNLLEANPQMAAVQPKILSWRDKTRFEYAGAAGGLLDALDFPFCRGRLFDFTELDNGQYNDTKAIFWASGACMMIRAEVYHDLGGLDEDFFAHMEEIDLAFKIHRSGKDIGYCGSSTVYHFGAGTLGYGSPRKLQLNIRNGLFLLFRHTPAYQLWWKLPVRVALDWLAAVQQLIKGSFQGFLAVFRGHAQFLGSLNREWNKRNYWRTRFSSWATEKLYPKSIIWEYFVLRKKVLERTVREVN